MHLRAALLASLALALGFACGGEPPPVQPPDAQPPEAQAADASVDEAPPEPAPCDDFEIVGSGITWLTGPPSAPEQRPLRCLSSGDALTGRYAKAVFEGTSNGKKSFALEESRVYDYPLDDPRANHSAVYYRLTEMALEHRRALPTARYPEITVFTGPYSYFDSEYNRTSITLGRGMLPGGNADMYIAGHEYGHHVVTTLAPQIHFGTLHEGMADLFACMVPGSDAELLPAVPVFLLRPCANARKWPDDKVTLKQTCTAQVEGFVASGWDTLYPSMYHSLADGCAKLSGASGEALEAHHTGRVISGALWALRTRIGHARFLPMLLRALQLWPMSGDFGALRASLLGADKEMYAGAHAAEIERELTLRGMTTDVDLFALEFGRAFPCLATPELKARGARPAGPMLSLPTSPIVR